ncbi:hypothetical protein FH609_006415 [Streptomyces sp. 3MP-14]|uniref:PH domain-containing protein n=1 Tax=Streptomyces mimosae TaxID=2586635 RepID=A0A5N6AP92_9ACTN|nr:MULTISPECIES: hypothetical protein [Streptomyces]KAB8169896.1 hypothetical protein FH607_004095 [Streptomyces mimosae]KAB8178644.1 hypothetical protein FH609_006415 [Streptomyces sp. 3MP-14]
MSVSEEAYEVRYGFDRRTLAVLAVSALFTVFLLVPGTGMSLGLRVAGLVLFAGGGLLMAAGALTRRTALRVDATGVLLGGSPVRYQATTAQVPWQDIRNVTLWRQRVPNGRPLLWIGVTRREGAPPLPGPGQGPVGRAVAGALVPVPHDLLMASRQVNGWRLDRDQLAAALARFAPGVELVDLP